MAVVERVCVPNHWRIVSIPAELRNSLVFFLFHSPIRNPRRLVNRTSVVFLSGKSFFFFFFVAGAIFGRLSFRYWCKFFEKEIDPCSTQAHV